MELRLSTRLFAAPFPLGTLRRSLAATQNSSVPLTRVRHAPSDFPAQPQHPHQHWGKQAPVLSQTSARLACPAHLPATSMANLYASPSFTVGG